MLANSQKTAIVRTKASTPCRWLCKQGRLTYNVLDWGCGRGADAAWLKTMGYNCKQYDPFYFPDLDCLEYASFPTILCTYVLNTIPDYFARAQIVDDMLPYLTFGGNIYISIRADVDNLNGWTTNGSWQGYVGEDLANGGFDLLRNVASYQIWRWKKT